MVTKDPLFLLDLEYETEDRYDWAKFMNWTDNHDPLTSCFIEELLKLRTFGNYIVATEEYRPDLISFKIYDDTQFWWILLLYNNLQSVMDLTAGVKIAYPSINDLEDIYFMLSAKSRGTN